MKESRKKKAAFKPTIIFLEEVRRTEKDRIRYLLSSTFLNAR